MKKLLFLFASFILCITAIAQKKQGNRQSDVKVVKVEGHYRMVQTEDLSESFCKREALEQARLHAIERHFGSYLSSSSVMLTSIGSAGSSESYSHYNTIDVRGIWLGDDDSKISKSLTDDGNIVWEAWVKGRARERSTTHIDFDVRTLVNGTELRYESNEMYDQDHFFIRFKSPVDGYLLIFATDGDQVTKFVPRDAPIMTIVAGKDYLFPDNLNEPYYEAQIAEGRQLEYYKLIVLFSRNELVSPNFSPSKRKDYEDVSQMATIVPLPEMKYRDFSRYYEQQLGRDSTIEPRIIELVLKRRN